MVRSAPCDGARAVGWISQTRDGKAERHVERVRRRSAVRRLDRWDPEACRRRDLQDPLHAAKADERLEPDQYGQGRRLEESGPDAAGGPEGARGAAAEQGGDLLVRTADTRAGRALPGPAPEEQGGVGVLRGAASLVQEDGRLVHPQREEGRDPFGAPRQACGGVSARQTAVGAECPTGPW